MKFQDKNRKPQTFAFQKMKEEAASQESNMHQNEIAASAVKTVLSSPGMVIAMSFETSTRNLYEFQ